MSQYIGRFAPSPTGLLHFGSLLAATASYLDARSQHGSWLLRLEDLDKPRELAGASHSIIKTLKAYGFEWDGDIIFQRQRITAYQQALQQLSPHTYRCICSRKQLQQTARMGAFGAIYSGTCRLNSIPENIPAATRLMVPNQVFHCQDLIQGYYAQNLQQDIGDFILKRADAIMAYQLAVVVDDAWQGITHIVRGSDLLDNTPRQLYLQHLLGVHQPRYAHIPIAVNSQGQKLSKQTYAPAISLSDSKNQLIKALHFLGQAPPAAEDFATLQEIWDWAIQHWQRNKIPKALSIASP